MRVTSHELTESESAQDQFVRRVHWHHNHGHRPLMKFSLITSSPTGWNCHEYPSDKATYQQAKQAAEAYRQTAVHFFQSHNFDVHAGLIDLGPVPRLTGSWLVETEQPAVGANGRTYPIKEIIL